MPVVFQKRFRSVHARGWSERTPNKDTWRLAIITPLERSLGRFGNPFLLSTTYKRRTYSRLQPNIEFEFEYEGLQFDHDQ